SPNRANGRQPETRARERTVNTKKLVLAGLMSALVALMALDGAVAHAQTGPACAAAKKKLAGKKDQKLLTCDAVAVSKGTTPNSDCLQKTRDGFSTGWDKAESRGGCFTSNDKSTIEAKVDAHATSVASMLPTGVVTTTTVTTTTTATLPGTRCCQATGACFDASTSDAMVKCPLLHGTLAPSSQKCNGQTGQCG